MLKSKHAESSIGSIKLAMVNCQLCKRKFKLITQTHLKKVHNIDFKDYAMKFGKKDCGLISPSLLPRNDPRYQKWRESLKKRPPPWSKGYTKETHPGVLKISQTMKNKKVDNFAKWRNKMKKLGKIRSKYPPFRQNGDLAELIGVILGDGHIGRFPRAESLTISSNANNLGFIKRYTGLLSKSFNIIPNISHSGKFTNCIRIRIYQKKISERLNIPAGSRKEQNIKIPLWILQNKEYLVRYLRGLYEAEGSFCVHRPTYTYKLLFSNRNKSLLKNVYRALKILGFHPHKSLDKIQVSRKEEVYKLKDLIKYRQY